MNNFEIINSIKQIVCPYFEFCTDDLYGNTGGSSEYPKIEEMCKIFFKLKCIDKKIISKNKQQEIVDKVKNLNIGFVQIETIPYLGRYIIIIPYKNTDFV